MAENPTTKPTTVDPTALAMMQAILAAGGAQGGTGAVSAPNTQKQIIMVNPRFDKDRPEGADNPRLIQIENPNYTEPKVTQPTAYGSAETGWYIPDPSSPSGVKLIVPAKTPNADEEIKKAIEREQAEQLRKQRQTNEAAGFGYADDDTVAKRSLEAKAANLDEKKYALTKAADDEKIRQFDIQQAAKDKVDAANIGLTTAQTASTQATTARTGAETTQIQGATERTAALLPGEKAQQAATLAGTEASTAGTEASTARTLQEIQQANVPKVQTPPTGMSQWQFDPKTGQVTQTGMNPEWQAKSLADVQARIGQIHSLMQQKSNEVQAKVDAGTLTAAQALTEFNQWYDQNVSPQAGQLQAAQQAAQFKQAQDEATMRASAYSNALAAGTAARENWTANNTNRVGPGWQAASEAAGRGDFKAMSAVPDSVTYRAPDVNVVANNAVNQALKYLSPSAAQATGTPLPNFQNVDIAQQLSSAPYISRFGGVPGAPTAPVGAGVGAGVPTGPVPPYVYTPETADQSMARNNAAAAALGYPYPF